ncbi:MAG: flagellar biosynthesis protein FlhF [Thiobacillus sp.]
MNVQTFIAPNAREALARIRRELGDDAVVLTTRTHSEGVEILASAYAGLSLQAPETEPSESAHGSRILKEIAHLRSLLHNQLAGFAWGANRRRDPIRVALLQNLFAAGFGSVLARTLAARLPRNLNLEAAQAWLRQILIRNLATVPSASDLVAQGGMLALVGPTGAGKTTTLAKLAERGVRRYGADNIALVCGDAYRIGAATQLGIYAELLGVALHIVKDPSEYATTLRALANQKLVLIDTAGFSPQDARVSQMHALDALGVRRVLVLAANVQSGAIEQVMTAYRQDAIACILSKWDESPQPGAALDSLIRHRLPLAYIASGQRVPEDLYAPNAAYLIDRALKGGQLATPYALQEADWPLFAGLEAERETRRAG